MSTHRYIATSFWDDEWIQGLDPSEKLLYLYLMTNPLTNIAGIYKISDKRMSFDTGFNTDTLKMIIGKFEKAGKAYRMGEYIVLPSWPKHQNWENKDDIFTGIVRILNALNDNELIFVHWVGYKFPLRDILTHRGVEPPPTPHELTYSILSNLNLININSSSGFAERESKNYPPEVEIQKPENFPKKPKKPPLREREPQNNMEKVEKAYLKNWDTLYTEKRVKTPDPIVNWNQTRALLKKHFERLSPEQIIQALNAGMADNFIMSGGYSMGIMLSASVLNRLLNSGQSGGPAPPPSLKDKKSLRGLDSW
ncbi:hypothetical protein FACS189461_1510 [Spirochaetia bacterium]|nr:hypothetical protein FACS189461_1510 [Spirochaetia bacterium]